MSRLAKRLLPWLLLAVVLVGGALVVRGRAPSVEVVRPAARDLAEVIALSGRVRGVEESQLAPEVGGTLRRYLVQEGQKVKKGQPLAEIDTARLRAGLKQSLEAVRVAEARLAVASRKPLPSEIEEVRGQIRGEQQAAQANLEAARQRWLEAQRGPRAEDITESRAALDEAASEAEQRSREAQRQKVLVADGAVSQQAYEQAETLSRRAGEAREAAKARLDRLQNGTRPEQVEAFRQQVEAAEGVLRTANQAGDARLEKILEQPRAEDVLLAQSQVDESRAAALLAQRALEQTVLLAPYDGVVGRRLLRVGDAAGPAQPALTFSSRPTLEVRIDVDESDRARLAVGQKAEIRANGFEGVFSATVRELSPEVDAVRGTLEARLTPDQAPQWLIPGQTVDVNLILAKQAQRLVIPLTSVVLKGDTAQVVVIENGVAHPRSVEVSSPTEQGYLVRSGLEEREQIALYPQGLVEGEAVRPKDAP